MLPSEEDDDALEGKNFLELARTIRLMSQSYSIKSDYIASGSIDDAPRLPLHLSFALSNVLDDIVDQLEILNAGMTLKSNTDFVNLEEKATRYFGDDPLFDPETGDPYNEYFQRRKLLKLYMDSASVIDLLTNLKNELKERGTFMSLSAFVYKMQLLKSDENRLFLEEKDNCEKVKQLKKTILHENRDNYKQIYEMNNQIATYKDLSEELHFENVIRIRYVKHWEAARREQGKTICDAKIIQLEDSITHCKGEIEKEISVNQEIENYLSKNQKEMEDSIEMWMVKYEKDSEQRIYEMQVLREKKEELEKEFQALQILYNQHKQEIEDYLVHKEQVRQEEERLAFLSQNALRIQAWWRGIMVRHKLGPYNPKKKKGKGKDKGKKGKK